MYQLTEMQQKVFNDRYALKDINGNQIENNIEETWNRVAESLSSIEINKNYWKKEFYNILYDFYFIPGGRIINSVGNENKTSFYNCYVLDSPEDSRQGIMKNITDMVEIMSRGGGVGINLSTLRPKGAYVKGVNGYSSGVVSWGELYSQATGSVCQGGSRRGALLLSLQVDHPDIKEFITAKQDLNKLTNANLSVLITDDFMNAVKNDLNWDLKFNDKIYKTIKASYLWNLICESAWKCGEPGVIFIDQYNKRSNTWYFDKIISCNPCLHKDTYLITENGLEKISQLKSKIWNGKNYVESQSWKTGIKPTIKLITKSGFEYITTPDHKFLLVNGQWCEAINTLGKKLKFELNEKEWIGYNPYPNTNYQILGFELGDGSYHKISNRMKYIYATKRKDQEVINLIENEFNDKFSNKGDNNFVIKIPYNTVYANAFEFKIDNRIIPNWILQLPKQQMRDFIKGLFSANGCNLKKYKKIQLASINKEMLQQIQQMLLLFGIKSKLWCHTKKHNVKFNNGIYECKQSYHLVISRKSYKKYLDEIGFIQTYKNGYNKCNFQNEFEYETVISINELDDTEVWDFIENKLHQGITNGAIVHNCGEQGLPAGGVCDLGSINLSKYYINDQNNDRNNQNTKQQTANYINCIDYEKLSQTIKNSVRFLDNVIDVTPYFFENIEKVQKNSRRIGLGTMGLADLLIKMKIRYGSDESIKFCDNLYKTIAIEAYKASIDLAEEKGAFLLFNFENHFLKNKNSLAYKIYKLLPESYQEKAKKYGIRNSTLLTIAPTGSTALLANTSSGIEPNFAFEIKRKDRLGEHIIIHYLYDKYKRENKETLLPEYFVTAQELDIEEHIKVQATIQNWIDSSISKTLNAPNSHTIQNVKDAYLLSYSLGNKGITYFRNGSRNDQVLTSLNKVERDEKDETKQKKLPRGYIVPVLNEAKGHRIKLTSGCGHLWLMCFTNSNNDIIESFVNTGSKGGCTASTQAMSRLISLALRGGIPFESVIDQLESAGSCPAYQFAKGKGNKVSAGQSCPSAIAKALVKLQNKLKKGEQIEDIKIKIEVEKNENQERFDKCPECGEKLKQVEGCKTCYNCGYSKCG